MHHVPRAIQCRASHNSIAQSVREALISDKYDDGNEEREVVVAQLEHCGSEEGRRQAATIRRAGIITPWLMVVPLVTNDICLSRQEFQTGIKPVSRSNSARTHLRLRQNADGDFHHPLHDTLPSKVEGPNQTN